MILHIDTETTDIFLRGQRSEHPGQPHLAAISAILDDEHGRIRGSFYSLVHLPDGVECAPKAFEVNGLTNALCKKYGAPLLATMEAIDRLAGAADSICAFANHFDMKFLKISCARLGDYGAELRARLEAKKRFCTMEASARHLKGPNQRFIKLIEAHRQLFGAEFSGQHTAFEDNMAQRRIYYRLRELGVGDFGDTETVGDAA